MYLKQSLKNIQIIYYRQKCLNWCQIVANRRHLSQDKNGDDDNVDTRLDKYEQKEEQIKGKESDDKVIEAKHNLNKMIETLKSKTSLGESDPRLKELLAKPKYHIRRSARKEETIDTKEENINEISSHIDKRLAMAAKGIAQTLSGEESKKTENELLKLLKLQVVETNLAKEGKALSKQHLASIVGDMKIVKEEKDKSLGFAQFSFKREFDGPRTRPLPRDQQIRRDNFRYEDLRNEESVSGMFLQKKRPQEYRQRAVGGSVGLFTGEGLGIFESNMKESSDSPKLQMWERLMSDELDYIIAQPPKNAFEEMIKWTEQGKLWKYPINNEQGLEEEEKVPFYEHVLLDHLLEGFPESGPVRKFMELVILGLSMNPYITVERKHATVYYYRQYFNEKEELLRLSGALG